MLFNGILSYENKMGQRVKSPIIMDHGWRLVECLIAHIESLLFYVHLHNIHVLKMNNKIGFTFYPYFPSRMCHPCDRQTSL